MEEGALIAEGLNLLSEFVETIGIFVRRCVPLAKDYANEIADYAKCVTFVSSDLQVVTCVSKAETRMEMMHVNVGWPCLDARLEDLRGAIVTSMISVLDPAGKLDELLVKNVFKVQQKLNFLSHGK